MYKRPYPESSPFVPFLGLFLPQYLPAPQRLPADVPKLILDNENKRDTISLTPFAASGISPTREAEGRKRAMTDLAEVIRRTAVSPL